MEYAEDIDEFAPAGNVAPAAPAASAADPTPATPAAPATQAEPEQAKDANAYDAIIAQQSAQIDALLAQNERLTNQITQLIQNGAQIKQEPAPNIFATQSLQLQDNQDYSLEALAKDIGKRDRH